MTTLRFSVVSALFLATAVLSSASAAPKVSVRVRSVEDRDVPPATLPGPEILTPCVEGASTYSTFDFSSGGTAIVQAGMAQTEIAAASYVLSAADFPVRLDAAQCVWGTQNATVTTTTQWSLLVWQGTPSTGTVVITVQSDGISIPHLVLPPGSNASVVEVDFLPDPPDNIVIMDNGTHTFSIGFRIDHHNQQTQNPCTVAPPSCCNAFPTVDTSGLQNAAQNWLFGVNCGPFGCPANGGWATFAALPVLCRPSGDWNLRAVYLPSYATAEVPGVSCADGIDNDCDGFTDCDDANCGCVIGAPVAGLARDDVLALEVSNPLPDDGADIRLVVPASGFYQVDVFDVQGRLVRALARQDFAVGEHHIRWQASGSGDAVAPGTYFLRATDGTSRTVTKKVTIVR